jgi:S1-C subfamily serine protease
LGLERAEGLVITEVTPGSAADEAGVARGRFDFSDQPPPGEKPSGLQREMAGSEKGKSVLLLVKRGQRERVSPR